jgi:NADH:ubiquinone reductase (H+-translocating)
MTKPTVILGAGYAGTLAAIRLARRTSGTRPITLVSASDQFVERIRLHQVLAGQALRTRSVAELLDGTGVEVVRGRITRIDPTAHEVHVEGRPPLHYAELVYALGSRTETSSVRGVSDHAFTLDGTLDRLARAVETAVSQGGRVTVCGAGLTGIECATELAEAFPSLRVTLISRKAPGAHLSQRARVHLDRAFERLRIHVVQNGIAYVGEHGVITEDGAEHPHDVCIWAGGFTAHPLATEAGIVTNERHQVVVDERLRSVSHPNVVAVGDAAEVPASCGYTYFGCATAMPMGAYAADQLAGRACGPFRYCPTFYCISLGRKDAVIQHLDANGHARESIFTARFGAFVKETICRLTVKSLELTKSWPGAVVWRQGDGSRLQLPPAQRTIPS